jgi:hypothetical protein
MTQILSAEASQALSSLEKKWPKLNNDVDRGRAIKAIHDLGVSYRALGERLHHSESGLRHLCQAAKAPVSDRLLAREKEISTRELVRRSITAQKKQAAQEKEARDLQRTEEAKKGAKIICEWLTSERIECGSAVGEQIVDEARRILHGAEQRGTLPNGAPPPPGTPIVDIIKNCRPKEDPNGSFVAHYATWLAVGSYYAFPDSIIRDRALNIALDKEIREED